MEGHSSPTSWLLQIPFLPHDESMIHVNGAIVSSAAICAFSLLAYRALKAQKALPVVPRPGVSILNMADALVDSLRGLVVGTVGAHGERYVPFIGAIFVFIFINNLLGLLPYSSAATSNPNTTFAIAISAFVFYNWHGVREHGVIGYLKHFLMGLGILGIPIALLEIVSHAIRPLSLGIRLFINMFVDHTVVMSFESLIAWLIPVPLLLFGIVISTIQAFVFATLTAVYVQMATEHDH